MKQDSNLQPRVFNDPCSTIELFIVGRLTIVPAAGTQLLIEPAPRSYKN